MTLSTVLVLIIGVLSYFVLPFLIWWLVKNQKVKNILTIVLFCCYLAVLFIGVFSQLSIGSKFISFKFDFTGKWCAKTINFSLSHITKFDLVINLLMLFPVGMLCFYFMRNKKTWIKILLLLIFGLLTGITIETFQFILPIQRSVQLSDALLNMVSVFVGGMIAWGYLWIIKKIKKESKL